MLSKTKRNRIGRINDIVHSNAQTREQLKLRNRGGQIVVIAAIEQEAADGKAVIRRHDPPCDLWGMTGQEVDGKAAQ